MALLACVYVLAAFCIASSMQTEYYKCEGGLPEPKNLNIEGCDKLPCSLVRGTDLKAHWDFAVTANTATLKPRVIVTVFGVTTEYDYPRPDACKDLVNGECPLEKGEEVTYSLLMPILKIYPNIRLGIEFSLIDENKNAQVCFKIDGKVVN
ncbi:NPC intracellular cholesterol transporter 2 homolog a-like [Vespula pensylvanica]|uniref:NPC intracellular cholesterol transporter 2 homolog a-like n=1 Tax=Vespula pensylvanica TaxID=30213 RepID=UPI001CB9EF39|nr:NPC intracellular cholesterol transporter 2 homolog a-like [Vespula pensylvanica]